MTTFHASESGKTTLKTSTDVDLSPTFQLENEVASRLNELPESSPFLTIAEFGEMVAAFLANSVDRAVVASPECVEIALGYGLNLDLVNQHIRRDLSRIGIVYETVGTGMGTEDSTSQVHAVIFGLDYEAVVKAVSSMTDALLMEYPEGRIENEQNMTPVSEHLLDLPPRMVMLQVESYEFRLLATPLFDDSIGSTVDRLVDLLENPMLEMRTSILFFSEHDLPQLADPSERPVLLARLASSRLGMIANSFTLATRSNPKGQEVGYVTCSFLTEERLHRVMKSKDENEIAAFYRAGKDRLYFRSFEEVFGVSELDTPH